MKDLYTQFIADYLDRNTRPLAQMNLLRGVELYREELVQQDIETVVTTAMQFVETYENSWWWQKREVIARSLRAFH